MINKGLKLYLGSFMSYGFYRGFNNTLTSAQCPKFNEQDILLTDKVVNGFFCSFIFLIPGTHPFIIYKSLVRFEKKYKNIELEESDFFC